MYNFLLSFSLFFFAGLPVALFILVFWLIVFRGAYFASTNKKALTQTINLVKNLQLKSDINYAVDLGSGDGRVVVALAKLGINTVGFEINPLLVRRSRRLINNSQTSEKASIEQRNFWKIDLNKFSLIHIFGIGYMMANLEHKLQKELSPGAYVISYYFTFPNWKPVRQSGKVYLYQR